MLEPNPFRAAVMFFSVSEENVILLFDALLWATKKLGVFVILANCKYWKQCFLYVLMEADVAINTTL